MNMKGGLCLLIIVVGSWGAIQAQTANAKDRRPFDKTRNVASSKTPVILYHGGAVMVAAKELT